MMLSVKRDAQGREMYDYFNGNRDVLETIERDDGFIEAYPTPRTLQRTKIGLTDRQTETG